MVIAFMTAGNYREVIKLDAKSGLLDWKNLGNGCQHKWFLTLPELFCAT